MSCTAQTLSAANTRTPIPYNYSIYLSKCQASDQYADWNRKSGMGYRVIHQSPDATNHRTPSKYRTEIQVIPTSIHLRLFPEESAFTAVRNAHLYCIRASIPARYKPAILLTSSSRCFFQALQSANSSLQ